MGGPVALGRSRTPTELLARLGRLALWIAVVVVLVRGAADVLAGEPTTPSTRVHHSARPVWPDDAARSLAVEFASAYLTHTPGDEAGARQLTELASPELANELTPRLDPRTPRQAVRLASVSGAVAVDDRHALVTVAATIATARTVGTRRITVPIARDRAGALVVYDLPSFAPAPARAATPRTRSEPLLGAERAAIEDVLTRIFRAYLAGDAGGLVYLVAPGARIAAAAGHFELLDVASLVVAGPAVGRGRLVLVTVHARDLESRATYALRYRVRLMRRDRWYVAELNGPGEG
jgi:Conjugative transposon protein TcpC